MTLTKKQQIEYMKETLRLHSGTGIIIPETWEDGTSFLGGLRIAMETISFKSEEVAEVEAEEVTEEVEVEETNEVIEGQLMIGYDNKIVHEREEILSNNFVPTDKRVTVVKTDTTSPYYIGDFSGEEVDDLVDFSKL